MRKPFEGVGNIIRFNWHFYVLVFAIVSFIIAFRKNLDIEYHLFADILLMLILVPALISLLASYYIYDFSGLYDFTWLKHFPENQKQNIANLNAGFDETSHLLKNRFSNSGLTVFDFYHPAKHTEVSIRRARKAYPPFPNTQSVQTDHLPLQDNSVDKIFVMLSAHEIRNDEERIIFFKEIRRALATNGKIIVTEHLRDLANFLAFNIGCFHFHSKTTWLKTFQSAGLTIEEEFRITPFITTFILNKNGTAS